MSPAVPKDHCPVQLPFDMGNRSLFGAGNFAIYKNEQARCSWAKVYFPEALHGPPKYVHGGAQAYLLDEVMGCTCWMHNLQVIAKEISLEFMHPVPIETWLEATGEILQEEPKNVIVKATLFDLEQKPLATSQGNFRLLDSELWSRPRTQVIWDF